MSRYKYLYANKWLDTKPMSLRSSYYEGETLPNSAILIDDACPPTDWKQIVFCDDDANKNGAVINMPHYQSDMCAWN